jgi:hypothetical protein
VISHAFPEEKKQSQTTRVNPFSLRCIRQLIADRQLHGRLVQSPLNQKNETPYSNHNTVHLSAIVNYILLKIID